MSITSHQIHSVLRTYGKQLRRGMRLNRIKQMESVPVGDKINISAEAKRLQVVQRVASEILMGLATPGIDKSGIENRVLGELSADFGQTLAVSFNAVEGRFDFKLVDEETGAVTESVDPSHLDELNARLVEIAERIVDETMLKG